MAIALFGFYLLGVVNLKRVTVPLILACVNVK